MPLVDTRYTMRSYTNNRQVWQQESLWVKFWEDRCLILRFIMMHANNDEDAMRIREEVVLPLSELSEWEIMPSLVRMRILCTYSLQNLLEGPSLPREGLVSDYHFLSRNTFTQFRFSLTSRSSQLARYLHQSFPAAFCRAQACVSVVAELLHGDIDEFR